MRPMTMKEFENNISQKLFDFQKLSIPEIQSLYCEYLNHKKTIKQLIKKWQKYYGIRNYEIRKYY